MAVPVGLATNGDSALDDSAFTMAPITPMPTADVLGGLGDGDVPIDTWVELDFVGDAGNHVATVRRSIRRTPRGKIEASVSGMSPLGLTPIGREIGTKMPGLIPYIRLGEACEIGKAVSAITGLKPLEDLVKHAEKVQTKLDRDLVKDRQVEIGSFDFDFSKTRSELLELIRLHPEIDPGIPLPLPSADKSIEDVLANHAAHYARLQAQALTSSKTVLGEAFDAQDPAALEDLMDSIGPAFGLLDSCHLKGLGSASRLSGLGAIDEGTLGCAEARLSTITDQAKELFSLAQEPDVAIRLRLYARVAGWLKGLPQPPHDVGECPICQTALGSRTDPVTRKTIAEHLSHYLGVDCAHVEKTVKDWETNVLGELRVSLPESLQAEIDRTLPGTPAELISHALVEELFESKYLAKSLRPLRATARALCDNAIGKLPAFVEPSIDDLPDGFDKSPNGVNEAIRRIRIAIAFSRWRRENEGPCKTAFLSIVGQASPGREPGAGLTDESSLHDRLAVLDAAVKNAEPLTNALAKIATMSDKLAKRRDQEARIALYARASKAIEPVFGLRALVATQVSFLVNALSSKTKEWKKSFYTPAFVGAPEVATTDVATDGSIEIQAVAGGARAPAHHVSNASDLRATLLAFLLAFWEYLLDSRGGLSLLLLDDLQELFDGDNRRRVANRLPAMLAAGGQLVVTTNDPAFGLHVMATMRRSGDLDKVDHRRIHPLRPRRDHIELGVFVEEIDAKKARFEGNVNDAQAAREYIKDLRIYLERMLLDLFEIQQDGLPKQPTLSDLIGAVRTRINAGHEAFSGRAFRDLVSDGALVSGSEFLNVMNESHHGREGSIAYGDVVNIRSDCVRIREMVDSVHLAYDMWMRRDPPEPAREAPARPKAITFPAFRIPIVEDLAAFTSELGPSEPFETEDVITQELLATHATYVLNSHNLGFSASPHCRIIVSVRDTPVPDNSLVVALHGGHVYARRLLRDPSAPATITLGSDAENPGKRPPSLLLPTAEVQLLQVAGILFDDRPAYPKKEGEAWPIDASDLMKKIRIGFKVLGSSAIPFALPGQTVLGGDPLTPSQVGGLQGHVVAVSTTDGAVLKRVGQAVPGAAHVRCLESIGGLGESMLVRLEEHGEALSKLPLMVCAREILGVLYTTPGTV